MFLLCVSRARAHMHITTEQMMQQMGGLGGGLGGGSTGSTKPGVEVSTT